MSAVPNSDVRTVGNGEAMALRQSQSGPAAQVIDFTESRRHRFSPSIGIGSLPGVTARIYRPSASATQAGRANTRCWVLEFAPTMRPEVDPLTGWTGSGDVLQQVRLTFPTRERAEAFARRRGWRYVVREAQEPRVRPKRHADNFRRPLPSSRPVRPRAATGG